MPSRGSVAEFQSFLRHEGLVFACAESCTGGLLASEMTVPAGSSEVFWGGVVSYANEAKVGLLGVAPGLLEAHGAVSGEVALAMVRGLLEASRAGLSVAITGVAGPSGGSNEKPVGTVWFAVAAVKEESASLMAVRHRFRGNRLAVQRQASRWARILARVWWLSEKDLDSLRSLTDNHNKPFVEASHSPVSFPFGPL